MKKKLLYLYRYWFWTVSRLFVFIYLRPKFNLIKDRVFNKIPKPPFIMISNHATFFDPWLIGHYSKYPLSIMNNEDAFLSPPLIKWYLKTIGTFPKKKGASDYKAMKTTIKRLKLGYPVLIFPEGQTTWDGNTQLIYPGIEKIIKRTKCSLVIMNIRGNFLSKPWWANTYRKGNVTVKCKTYSPNELENLSEQEILEIIIKQIQNNDILNKENFNIQFKGKNLAGGLERFVWICKNCLSEDTLNTKGDNIFCSQCNSSWTVDSHFRFISLNKETASINNLYDWALWHKQRVMKRVEKAKNDEILTRNKDVIYCTISSNGKYENIANGELALSKETLSFQAMDNEKSFNLSVKEVTDYVYQRKDVFECRRLGESYKFRTIGYSPMKWIYYFRYLNNYEKFEERGYL